MKNMINLFISNKCTTFCLIFIFHLIATSVNAQIRIKGKITDENNEALIGASVLEKGTNNGTVTDIDGNYSIIVTNEKSKLVISYLGYISYEFIVKDKRIHNVQLQSDTQALDEVIVVGYGTQKRTSLTGAVSQIRSEELQKAPTGNLSSMLQGRIPGLISKQSNGQPGYDNASLYVRGVGSGDGKVLVVVDGIVRSFPSIPPEEIESITVLKDAASAAVYGFNGSGGVILITTKKGIIQKPTISLNSSISLSTNTAFPEFLNGKDYMYWYNKAQVLDGVPESGLRFTKDELERVTAGDPYGTYTNTNWFDMLFRESAPTYTNNISMSGGDDRFKYFVSLGAYNQKGTMKKTSYDRYNVRTNIDGKISKNFSMSFGMGLRQCETSEPGVAMSSILSHAMIAAPYLPATTYSGLPVAGLNSAGNGAINPVALRDQAGSSKTTERRIESNISFKYDIPWIKGLSAKFVASYDYQENMKKQEFFPYEIAVYNQSTRQWYEGIGGVVVDGKASVSQAYYNQYDYFLQPSVEYNGTFGKHTVKGLFLYEYGGVKYESMAAGKKGYPIEDIMDLTWGNEVMPNSVSGIHNQTKRGGYVARLNYEYDGKYLFELSGRLDGTAYLPSKNRWGLFPAISVGWRLSEESFIKDRFDWIDNLKLRMSAGQLGSENGLGYGISYISMVSLTDKPVFVGNNTLYRSLNLGSVPNPNLKWQLTDTYNIGVDASFWKGLLGIELDVFYSLTKRKIEVQTGVYPPSLGGYYSSLVNYGKHENKGLELVLTHQNRVGDLTYNVRGNVSWAKNKILRINENTNVPDSKRFVGKSVGQYYGFKSDGLFQSEEEIANSAVFGPTLPGDIKLVDINGDGKITIDQDMVPIGRNNIPEMTFGLNLSASYKGFDFNAFFQGAALCDIYLCGTYPALGFVDDTFYTRTFFCDGNAPYYLVENSWTPEHTNAKYPRLSADVRLNGGKYSDWWVRNGNYLRLKSAQIGYTIPQKLTQKVGIEKIRTYVSGSNLFTICGIKYFDPEMPNVNQGYYPQQRVYEFGLNITF